LKARPPNVTCVREFSCTVPLPPVSWTRFPVVRGSLGHDPQVPLLVEGEPPGQAKSGSASADPTGLPVELICCTEFPLQLVTQALPPCPRRAVGVAHGDRGEVRPWRR
jgi:hypothetical protein